MIWAAYALGAFYLAGGVLVINGARTELFLDGALKKLTGEPTPVAERIRAAYGVAVGVLMVAGGAALLLRSWWASVVFGLGVVLQAVYLVWATRALPPQNAEEAKGRRGGFNAFVIYSAATAFVLWLQLKGLID